MRPWMAFALPVILRAYAHATALRFAQDAGTTKDATKAADTKAADTKAGRHEGC